jgi:hypothetical protein
VSFLWRDLQIIYTSSRAWALKLTRGLVLRLSASTDIVKCITGALAAVQLTAYVKDPDSYVSDHAHSLPRLHCARALIFLQTDASSWHDDWLPRVRQDTVACVQASFILMRSALPIFGPLLRALHVQDL